MRKGLKFLMCFLVGVIFIPTVKAEGIAVNDIVTKFNEIAEDERNEEAGTGMTAAICTEEQDTNGDCTKGNIYITIVMPDEYDDEGNILTTSTSYLELALQNNILSCTMDDTSTQYFALYDSILAVFELQGKEYKVRDLTATIEKIAFDSNASLEKDGMTFTFNDDDSVNFCLDVTKDIKLVSSVLLRVNQSYGNGAFKIALVDDEYEDSATNIVNIYTKGDKVKLKAVANDEDYKFANWLLVTEGENEEDDEYEVYSFDEEITIELTDDMNLVLNFTLKETDEEEFEVTEGNNQKYEKGKDLVITANGEIFNLLGIKVDNVFISSKNFSIVNGSTILKLNSEYLDILSAGDHTVTFVYANGSVDATISIPEAVKNPNTSDNISYYIGLFLFSFISLNLIKKYCY